MLPPTLLSTFNERVGASTDASKMIRITPCGVEVAIPSGQSDRVYVLVSVDLPNGFDRQEESVRRCGRRRLSGHGKAMKLV